MPTLTYNIVKNLTMCNHFVTICYRFVTFCFLVAYDLRAPICDPYRLKVENPAPLFGAPSAREEARNARLQVACERRVRICEARALKVGIPKKVWCALDKIKKICYDIKKRLF